MTQVKKPRKTKLLIYFHKVYEINSIDS